MTTPADEVLPPDLAVDGPPPLDDLDLAAMFASELDGILPVDTAQAVAIVHAQGWRIEDHSAAEWAGRKLSMAEAVMRPYRELHAMWVAQLDAWLADVTRDDARTAAYMTARLEDYALRLRAAGADATLTLPSVVLRTRATSPKAEVADEALVADWWDSLLAWAFGDEPLDDPDEAVRRQALASAIVEQLGEATPADVVKRDPKVYLAPWRRLVTLGVVSEGWRARIEYECEHWSDLACEGLADPELPAIGALAACPQCHPDPIEGQPTRHVTDVTVYEQTEPAVFGPDGLRVPGAEVDPGGIKPTVVPR